MKNFKTSFFYLIIVIFLFGGVFCVFNEDVIASAPKNRGLLVKYENIQEVLSIDNVDDVVFDSEIEYIEPNFLYNASMIPSDTFLDKQWYLKKIKAYEAWDVVRESEDIIIAIIDSGVQINHPDLKDNIWINEGEIADNGIDDDNNGFIDDVNGWDFVGNVFDPNPKLDEGFTKDGVMHGTIVAGVAAASGNNAAGIAGVTWRSKIMPLRVLDGKGEGDTKNVIRAIDYAIKNGADIINFSFVGFGFSRSLEAAIERAYNAGIIMVAAAGNDSEGGEGYSLDKNPMYPVCHDGKNGENMVIGVAATDAIDQKTLFSGYGNKCIDLSAPGISIFSTAVADKSYNTPQISFNSLYDGYWSGTSMAVPIVSGAVALVEAVNPRLGRDDVVRAIVNGSDNINKLNPDYLNLLGRGRLNLYNSVNNAFNSFTNAAVKLILAPKSNKESIIKLTERNGDEFREFFAYNENFRGGVNVAVGDVDGDGKDEIVTGAGFTGGPHVRIFKGNGSIEGGFFAYDKNFRGGVNVAVANFDTSIRNSKSKIITSPGPGGGPQIKIFDNHSRIYGQFFAYNEKFKGGVNIYSSDIDLDGRDEIITGAGPTGAPHVRVFRDDGVLINSFYGFEEEFLDGINVAAIELN